MTEPAAATSAAFFDLDKTILAKSSSLAFARPFYREGLIGRGDVLRSAYAQFAFLVSGADHDQMEKMRAYLSALAAGWEVAQVRRIVAQTLDEIIDPVVYEEAADLIAEHRAAGRAVIIISSSGTEIVEAIGERLGVDRAIGTQLQVVDGRYTGQVLFYAYGIGKADAMRALAEQDGYDLASSYAYSDSMTDLPMLETVGHPYAVNPDASLRRLAIERDWPVLDFARPVAMRSVRQRLSEVRPPEQLRAVVGVGVGVAAGAVALGVAWYAARHRTAG
ncbi:MAG TPA: HAD-IB family hydrolase [Candidatus Nanopelagicales bacterium]|jgi:HAD superfamily hydrolase (TIGR01490 family)|nr:HAD-IB family hydrolase [Candidatus Nanopelagicales bacterium]